MDPQQVVGLEHLVHVALLQALVVEGVVVELVHQLEEEVVVVHQLVCFDLKERKNLAWEVVAVLLLVCVHSDSGCIFERSVFVQVRLLRVVVEEGCVHLHLGIHHSVLFLVLYLGLFLFVFELWH